MEIYRKHPDADAYSLDGGTVYTPYAYLAREKRFTTAELLAQYWFACTMGHSPVFAAVHAPDTAATADTPNAGPTTPGNPYVKTTKPRQ